MGHLQERNTPESGGHDDNIVTQAELETLRAQIHDEVTDARYALTVDLDAWMRIKEGQIDDQINKRVYPLLLTGGLALFAAGYVLRAVTQHFFGAG